MIDQLFMTEAIKWLLSIDLGNAGFWLGLGVLIWLCTSFIIFMITFVCYAAVTHMDKIKNELFRKHWTVRWASFLALAFGLVFDTLLNWYTLSVAFIELPQEFLSTARVTRHKYDSTHWRQTQARWWCANWLEPFDIGHCNK